VSIVDLGGHVGETTIRREISTLVDVASLSTTSAANKMIMQLVPYLVD